MFALISTEELEGLGQIMVKQLKNRYNDPTIFKRFVVGVDRAKMRLYDCEQQAQDDILDNKKDEEYNDEDKKPFKKSFKPDIIFIDYLNICASSRYRAGSNVNSYSYIKAIAEELRGLAVEANVPIVSATQTTRSGFASSDVDLTDTSESFGLPATADLMFALISTEELEALNQIMVKQLKNRYNDPTIYKRFVVGVDRAKMRLYDCEQQAQDDILDNKKDEEYNDEDKKPFKKSFAEFKF